MTLIDITKIETVEIFQDGDVYNVRIGMVSGRRINNYYTTEELAQEHYDEIKAIIPKNIENKQDRLTLS
jgi:hypothetical protein